ncbi:MAG: HEAT repeat domain-containing protein [Planctomycetota bacterium]
MRIQILVILIIVLTGLILYLEWPSQPADKAKEIRVSGIGGRRDTDTGRPKTSSNPPDNTVGDSARPLVPDNPDRQKQRQLLKEKIESIVEELRPLLQNISEPIAPDVKNKILKSSRLLAAMGQDGTEALLNLILESDEDFASLMLEVVRSSASQHRVELLLEVASNHQSNLVRAASVKMLADLKVIKSLTVLMNIIYGNNDTELKIESASSIGKIGTPESESLLFALAKSTVEEEQRLGIVGLSCIRKPEVVNFLLDLFSSSTEGVRIEAAAGLGRLKDKTAEKKLKNSFINESSEAVAAACINGLTLLQGESETIKWLKGLRSDNENTVDEFRVVLGISAIGGQAAQTELLSVVKSKQYSEAAKLSALQKLDTSEFKENKQACLNQIIQILAANRESESIRSYCETILTELGETLPTDMQTPAERPIEELPPQDNFPPDNQDNQQQPDNSFPEER